jgi:hypothetical protein
LAKMNNNIYKKLLQNTNEKIKSLDKKSCNIEILQDDSNWHVFCYFRNQTENPYDFVINIPE